MLMHLGRLAPKRTVQWSEAGSEVVVLDRTMGEVLRLNPVAGFIWKQLDGHRSAEEVVTALSQHFHVDRRTAKRDVERFLRQLIGLEIVEDDGEP